MHAKILLVDDDAMSQWALGEALADVGHTVVPAATGDHAAELMAEHPDIDILVTDIALVGPVSGLQLARYWRNRTKRPTIFITGFSETDAGLTSLDRRDAFLRKPFRAEDLIRLLEVLLAARDLSGQQRLAWHEPRAV